MTSEECNFLLSMLIGTGIVFVLQFLWYFFRGYK